MPRSAFGSSPGLKLALLSGPLLRQCYQETHLFAYPRLRRSAAQNGGNISAGSRLENAAPNVKCPGMNSASQVYDTVVIGGGPAGVTAALALAATGARTGLLARRVPYADNRTTALLGASTDLLERLDVWPRCRDKAAALRTMRLVDDTGRLIRAPEVRFSSLEIGLEQFGFNIDNRSLITALEERAAELPNLTRHDDEAATIDPQDD